MILKQVDNIGKGRDSKGLKLFVLWNGRLTPSTLPNPQEQYRMKAGVQNKSNSRLGNFI